MATIICTPKELLAAQPCLACLSSHQLLAVIALALCKFNGGDALTDCAPAVLLEDATCFNCMSNKQQLEALVTLIVNWGIDNELIASDTDLRSDVACMMCLSDHDLKSIILKLICEGVANGNVFCLRQT